MQPMASMKQKNIIFAWSKLSQHMFDLFILEL